MTANNFPGKYATFDPIVPTLFYILAVSVFFLLFPSVDLWVTGLFYDPATGFAAARTPFAVTLRASQDRAIAAVVILLLASLVAKLAVPGRPSFIAPGAALFLLASLAAGPGLVVNLLFKEHWGRPRPATVDVFGGEHPYVPVWQVTNYCDHNCSFVSGEASSALWLVAAALLLPGRYRRVVVAVTALYALALSINRIAAGRHFTSDVLLSWGLTALVMAILYRVMCERPPDFLRPDRLEAAFGRAGASIRRAFSGGGSR
jgi:membrane-associated phospholipid phosphatase